MMQQIIPLTPVAAQTFGVVLGGQQCKIRVYQKSTGVYLDLLVNDELVIGGVIARNLVRIVRDAYFGFAGDLFFYDTQGISDPAASGLGARFLLVYAS